MGMLLLMAESSRMPSMYVWDNGDGEIYVRMPWNSTLDLAFNAKRQASHSNANFTFDEFGTVSKSTAVGGVPSITPISSFGDETLGYLTAANGRAGGGHALEIVAITKAAHGLTTADIGKRFQDASSRLFAVTDIVSSSVFWMVQQPITLVGDAGATRYLPAAGTLTGLDGLSDLTGWASAYTGSTVGPTACADLTQQFLVDGRTLNPGETVNCRKFEVVETSRVPNLRNAYSYFTSTGSSAAWTDAGLGSMWTRTITYTFLPWAQLTVTDSATTAADGIRFTDTGNIQYNPMLGFAGATNLHAWVPGVGSITFTGSTVNGNASPTLDFNTPQYLGSGSGTDLNFELSTLIPGVIPDHVIQMVSGSTGSHSGWTAAQLAALDPTYQDGVPATRSGHTKEFLRVALSSRKFYPQNFSRDSTFPLGTTINLRSHRKWTPAVSGIDFWTFVQSGTNWLVYAAWVTSPGAVELTLPTYLRSYTATAERAFRCTLDSANTNDQKLRFTTSADNGLLIAKLAR
jgi:hypothetical protein